ncbi:MAG: hypothetical protein EPO30_07605 [Lysobacteraceae bacterium]|nr:MAG: hypothetical protein EPO30_07605 [Xanthomonadaceae bacterium]
MQFALQGGADGLMSALIDEQAEHDLRSIAPALQGRPVLLIGAAEDTLASVDNHLLPVAEAMQDAGVDVTRVILPGGHGISDADYAGRLAQWMHGECMQRDALHSPL